MVGLATLGPLGKQMKAPGTVGSAVGLIWYAVFFAQLSPLSYTLLLLLTVYLAMGICEVAQAYLGERDPNAVILDEMVVIPLCFIGMQGFLAEAPWILGLIGFGLFRFFDIVKPFGIKRLQALPGGIGIVADDLAAALATRLCLQVVCKLFLQSP